MLSLRLFQRVDQAGEHFRDRPRSRTSPNSAFGEGFEFRAVAFDQRELFGVGPPLQLTFTRNGIGFCGVLFSICQYNGSSARSSEGTASLVVQLDSRFDLDCVTHVQAVVGTAQNIDKKGTGGIR